MAQTDLSEKSKQADPISQAYGENSALKIPFWFLVVAVLLFGVRIYTKETQMRAAPGQGVAWITPVEFKREKDSGQLGKQDLVLYEFTADWCPPCKKRERTTFRNPETVKKINSNFIPVRVDLTTEAQSAQLETKILTDRFDVTRIPHCSITLKSGEFVCNDNYLFGDTFEEFLDRSITRARNVRAELLLGKGQFSEALACLTPAVVNGTQSVNPYSAGDYLMCHHLLTMLHRQAEIEPMMTNTYEATIKERVIHGITKPTDVHWLDNLNSYLRGQLTDEQLLAKIERGENESEMYLAIGLKHLRDGDMAKAKTNLNKSALLSAKSYRSDKVAENILKEIDK
ncbi:MAG: thioredoxin family protein [Cyanobacteria bacterium SZAS LIN-3]|nr:thioredoxin family protein [Cyanobacteria bacterium SZAS LIN-3]MBS2005744.1 thioredoxin family protein [Cyanobacteria bacterium SZAS TMP-1]